MQIRLDQEKQEQIQREKELLRLAEEEKMREIEREKDPQQYLDNLDHSISAATDTASIAIATANNNASNMANNSMRKRKPIAYGTLYPNLTHTKRFVCVVHMFLSPI